MKPLSVGRRLGAFIFLISVGVAPALARPLITEDVAPLERWMFEAAFAPSYRVDTYRAPKTDYETVRLPVDVKLGFPGRVEAGLRLDFVSQRLETSEARYDGSRTGLFSPQIKISPSDYFGVQFFYHAHASEEGNQELPIARGDDYEVKALLRAPVRFPLQLNVGYLFRNAYHSRFGIRGGTNYKVEPGDVFETSVAGELPLRWGFGLLTELAYYAVKKQTVAGLPARDSNGEALDALAGLTWTKGGWSIGTGFAFGLLDEQHTSFGIERGAGDFRWQSRIAYRLHPKKPES